MEAVSERAREETRGGGGVLSLQRKDRRSRHDGVLLKAGLQFGQTKVLKRRRRLFGARENFLRNNREGPEDAPLFLR